MVGGVRRPTRPQPARRRRTTGAWRGLPQDLVLGDPGPEDMFDDRLYKRGAITLHALRGDLGDDAFFGCCGRGPTSTGTAP